MSASFPSCCSFIEFSYTLAALFAMRKLKVIDSKELEKQSEIILDLAEKVLLEDTLYTEFSRTAEALLLLSICSKATYFFAEGFPCIHLIRIKINRIIRRLKNCFRSGERAKFLFGAEVILSERGKLLRRAESYFGEGREKNYNAERSTVQGAKSAYSTKVRLADSDKSPSHSNFISSEKSEFFHWSKSWENVFLTLCFEEFNDFKILDNSVPKLIDVIFRSGEPALKLFLYGIKGRVTENGLKDSIGYIGAINNSLALIFLCNLYSDGFFFNIFFDSPVIDAKISLLADIPKKINSKSIFLKDESDMCYSEWINKKRGAKQTLLRIINSDKSVFDFFADTGIDIGLFEYAVFLEKCFAAPSNCRMKLKNEITVWDFYDLNLSPDEPFICFEFDELDTLVLNICRTLKLLSSRKSYGKIVLLSDCKKISEVLKFHEIDNSVVIEVNTLDEDKKELVRSFAFYYRQLTPYTTLGELLGSVSQVSVAPRLEESSNNLQNSGVGNSAYPVRADSGFSKTDFLSGMFLSQQIGGGYFEHSLGYTCTDPGLMLTKDERLVYVDYSGKTELCMRSDKFFCEAGYAEYSGNLGGCGYRIKSIFSSKLRMKVIQVSSESLSFLDNINFEFTPVISVYNLRKKFVFCTREQNTAFFRPILRDSNNDFTMFLTKIKRDGKLYFVLGAYRNESEYRYFCKVMDSMDDKYFEITRPNLIDFDIEQKRHKDIISDFGYKFAENSGRCVMQYKDNPDCFIKRSSEKYLKLPLSMRAKIFYLAENSLLLSKIGNLAGICGKYVLSSGDYEILDIRLPANCTRFELKGKDNDTENKQSLSLKEAISIENTEQSPSSVKSPRLENSQKKENMTKQEEAPKPEKIEKPYRFPFYMHCAYNLETAFEAAEFYDSRDYFEKLQTNMSLFTPISKKREYGTRLEQSEDILEGISVKNRKRGKV